MSRSTLIDALRQHKAKEHVGSFVSQFCTIVGDRRQRNFQIVREQELRAVLLTEPLKQRAANALQEMQNVQPSHIITVADEISLSIRTSALEARARLDNLQETVRKAAAIETGVLEDRNTARLDFIAAAEACLNFLRRAGRVKYLTPRARKDGDDSRRGHQLSIHAGECKRVVEAAEPERRRARWKSYKRKIRATGKRCKLPSSHCSHRRSSFASPRRERRCEEWRLP